MKGYDYEEILLVKVAWYYYIEGLTQQEIGEHLGIPRLRVNRLLDKARKNGTIHFSVRPGDDGRMSAEQKLIRRFGLKDAFIVPSPVNPAETNENVAQAAAMYIHDHLDPDSYINMGYGDTPSRVLNHLANMSESPIKVVSLTGGVSYYLPNTQSSIFNAKLFLTPSPLLMQTREMVQFMKQEPSIEQIFNMSTLAAMTIVGIGSIDEGATIIKNGLLTQNDFLLLKMKGAVGDMLCHFLDQDGQLIESDIEDRLISTSLETLKSLRNTVGVAAGEAKARGILAALRGKYLDVLVTDEDTANQILSIDEPFA